MYNFCTGAISIFTLAMCFALVDTWDSLYLP